MTGIYVHIPFCAVKCPYCDFYSGKYIASTAQEYTNAVLNDMESYRRFSIKADTLYFGGGTPSLLSPGLIGNIINKAKDIFSLEGEITLEANPNTVNLDKLVALHDCGVNRISFGVQSANEDELLALGRHHTAKQAADAIENAYNAGISNISADLMLGIPKSSLSSLKKSIDFLTALPISHISAYILKLEPNTPFGKGELPFPVPDDDTQSDMYLYACEQLEAAGFYQYEISNFAKPSFESRHNSKYWLCEEYIGFGASAHSLFNGQRFYNTPDTRLYIENGPQKIVSDDNPCTREEQLMLSLRLKSGAVLYDTPFDNEVLAKAELFIKSGLLKRDGNRIFLTRKGMLLSNTVISELIF